MKRFGGALLVALGIAVLASVVSLVPQKKASAQDAGPTVTIGSPVPLPVKGNVNAIVTNNTNSPVPVSGNVGVTGNVPVANPMNANGNNIPLLTRDADNGARHFFLFVDTCTFDGASNCNAANAVFPIGQTLVLEDVSGECTVTGPFSPTQVAVEIIEPVGESHGALLFTPVAVPSSASPTVFGFGRTVKAYVPHPGFATPLVFFAHGASLGSSCVVTYSGYLITP